MTDSKLGNYFENKIMNETREKLVLAEQRAKELFKGSSKNYTFSVCKFLNPYSIEFLEEPLN
jgi:hypothetical protein